MLGLVVKNTGSWYCVKADDGRMVDCKVKGNFRLKGIRSTNPVAVGDRVEIRLNPEGTAFITAICDRRNYIIRRSSNLSKQSHILAANVDQALLVVTVNYPETSTTFIDRFLAGAEAYRVPVILAFNKLDLLSEDERRYQAAMRFLYENIGYTVVELSAHDADDVARLLPLLQGQSTLLSGNSGVGKSTLINAILPGANLRTADISEAHNTGMHTTTFSEMLPLPGGGYLIDTPGIKGFGLIDIADDEVCRYFPDLLRHASGCAYYNCTHTHEPGCAVTAAVERGDIAPQRYISYIKLLDEDGKYRQ